MSLLQRALGALYRRYFGSKFDVIIERTSQLDRQLHDHIHGINLRLIEITARLDAIERHTQELERATKAAMAEHWDETAITRRMAALEDRLAQSEPR